MVLLLLVVAVFQSAPPPPTNPTGESRIQCASGIRSLPLSLSIEVSLFITQFTGIPSLHTDTVIECNSDRSVVSTPGSGPFASRIIRVPVSSFALRSFIFRFVVVS